MTFMALGMGPGTVALAASTTAPLVPLVSQSFTTNSAGSDWVLPADPSIFGIDNGACLTAGGTPSPTSSVPQCPGASDANGSGSLQLTSSTPFELGTVFYAHAVPTENALVVRFDTYQYGACGSGGSGATFAQGNCTAQAADGLGFVLTAADPGDPVPPQTGGNPGGSLGYGPAPASSSGATPPPGIADGYLGIGLDVYGNYLNPYYNLGSQAAWDASGSGSATTTCGFYAAANLPTSGSNGSPVYPEQLTVKGPGNDLTGYCPLATTQGSSSQFALDQPGSSTRPSNPVAVELVLNPGPTPLSVPGVASTTLTVAARTYAVQLLPYAAANADTLATTPTELSGSLPTLTSSNDYDGLPASWVDPNTGLPYQLAFGFTASTGEYVETHEITNVEVDTVAPALDLTVTDSVNHVMTAGVPATFVFTPGLAADGGSVTQALTLSGTFPSGIIPDVAGASGTGWTCAAGSATGSFTCTYATPSSGIAPGNSVPPVSIPATAPSASSVPLTVSATVSSPGAVSASGSDSVTVVATQTKTPTTVPVTHTGEPWAGGTLWFAWFTALAGGGVLLVVTAERRARASRP